MRLVQILHASPVSTSGKYGLSLSPKVSNWGLIYIPFKEKKKEEEEKEKGIVHLWVAWGIFTKNQSCFILHLFNVVWTIYKFKIWR